MSALKHALVLAGVLMTGLSGPAISQVAGPAMTRAAGPAMAQAAEPAMLQADSQLPMWIDSIIERGGISLQVQLSALETKDAALPTSGDSVRLRLSSRRLADDQPLSGLTPGAWLDRDVSLLSGAVPVCAQRIAGLLSGQLLARPLLDITGYFLLTLDAEGSLSVLDPDVDFAGRTSLYKQIPLGGVPFDWLLLEDHSLAFIAMPDQRRVIVVDLQTLDIVERIDTGMSPTRLALSPDQRLLWVGTRNTLSTAMQQTDTQTDESMVQSDISGKSEQALAIDTYDFSVRARIDIPAGHHEFAFDDTTRQTWVSSRDTGMLVSIDSLDFQVKHQIDIGGQPLSISWVSDAGILWLADAEKGQLVGLDAQGQMVARQAFEPGIGPVRLAPDERTLILLNPSDHRLRVLDAGTGRTLHSLTVTGRPFDISFTESYLYVRTLDSPQIALFDLASLRKDPVPQAIPTGQQAMSAFAGLPIASSQAPTISRTGMFFASAAERTLYHFMEGMNAPDRSIRTFGHTPIAVITALRGLREVSPGNYEAVFKLPSSGRLVLALALDTPVLRECIPLEVAPPTEQVTSPVSTVQWKEDPVVDARIGEPITLRFASQGSADSNPRLLLVDGGGGMQRIWTSIRTAEDADDFTATGVLDTAGGYYVYIQADGRTQPALGGLPATLQVYR